MPSWRSHFFTAPIVCLCNKELLYYAGCLPTQPQLQLIIFILISWTREISIEIGHLKGTWTKKISIYFSRKNHRPKCLSDWESKPLIAGSIIINIINITSFPSLGCFMTSEISGFIFLWIQCMLMSYSQITLISLPYLLAFLTLCWCVCSFAFHH